MVLPFLNQGSPNNIRWVEVQLTRLTHLVESRKINRDHFIHISGLIDEYARANQSIPRNQFNAGLNTLVDSELQAITMMNPYGFS